MTYCYAWKQNGEVYMVGDTLFSTKIMDESIPSRTSIGEETGKYGDYFVNERASKLFRIENVLFGFSGSEHYLEEITRIFDLCLHTLEVTEILKNICSSFSSTAVFELLVAHRNNGESQLFYVTPTNFEVINTFKSIGSGNSIPHLTSTLSNFTIGLALDKDNSKAILSKMVSFLQIIIYKNGFLDYGVGGTVCGACLEEEIIWNDDILYYFYDTNIIEKKTLNIFIRKDFVLTGSDFTNENKLFASLLEVKNNTISDNFIRKVNKIISTGRPRYIVFYSKFYNCIYFCDVQRELLTSVIKIYYKRGVDKNTKITLLINPHLSRDLCSRKSEEKINIPVFYVETKKIPPISRKDALMNIVNLKEVEDKDEEYDHDLNQFDIFVTNKIDINTTYLNQVSNFIIIDFNFLFKAFKERYYYYNGFNLDINHISFLKILNKYIHTFYNEDIKNHFIIFFSDEHNYKIKEVDLFEVLKKQIDPSSWYNFNGKDYDNSVNSNTCKILQDYYVNEDYFGIDKIVLMMDNEHLNEILSLMPTYNYNPKDADIVLIRSHNLETFIHQPITYYVIDNIIDEMFNISYEDSILWDSYKNSPFEKKIRKQILDNIY